MRGAGFKMLQMANYYIGQRANVKTRDHQNWPMFAKWSQTNFRLLCLLNQVDMGDKPNTLHAFLRST